MSAQRQPARITPLYPLRQTPAHPVLCIVARVFEVTPAELVSPCRTRHLAQARQAAMWLFRQRYPSWSLQCIAAHLGHRDHTTIRHGIAQAALRATLDPRYAALLDELLQGEA
jgi:chromosomal replication initiation ATPase DnaA